jgi:cytochrome oxidase Cu insertion factor (SCO1/SenC/PrrC family)
MSDWFPGSRVSSPHRADKTSALPLTLNTQHLTLNPFKKMLRFMLTFLTIVFLVIVSASCRKEDEKIKIPAFEKRIDVQEIGVDLKLYGKMLDNKDFNWEALRGKYVLVKFTSTSCPPCRAEIPGMLKAYKQYRDKGLEIVSVYTFDQIDETKELVAEEGLPWLVISEDLTQKANQPIHLMTYDCTPFPMMVLVDKDGKVIDADVRGEKLQTRLAELLDEK